MTSPSTRARRTSGARRGTRFVFAAAACAMAVAAAPVVDRGRSAGGDTIVPARRTPVTHRAETPVTHRVEMRGFQFVPTDLRIGAGDTVVWVNADPVPHTATAADGSWDTGSVAPGDSAALTSPTAGKYLCTFHPSMPGTIAVRGR
jgi:plastocyanin